METQVKKDYIIDFNSCGDLTAAGDAGLGGDHEREFAIENMGTTIAVGVIQVITAAGGKRDAALQPPPATPDLSTEWRDIQLYHGYSYCWCKRLRKKPGYAGVLPILNLGYSTNIGE